MRTPNQFHFTLRKIERNLMAHHEIRYPNDSRHRLKHRAATANLRRWRQGRRESTKFCPETSRPPRPAALAHRQASYEDRDSAKSTRRGRAGYDSDSHLDFHRRIEKCQWSAAEQDISRRRNTVTQAAWAVEPGPARATGRLELQCHGATGSARLGPGPEDHHGNGTSTMTRISG